jgi:hypothetical protein
MVMGAEIERIGVCLMNGTKAVLRCNSSGPLVVVVSADGLHVVATDMTVAEAKAWRAGLSRAIRQAESVAVAKASDTEAGE